MNTLDFPLLSLLILLPLTGAVIVGAIQNFHTSRLIALTFAMLELLLATFAIFFFDSSIRGFQLVEQYNWIPQLKIEYMVGVDGISILFLPLSALLTVIVTLASWNSVQHNRRFHFAMLLALQGVTVGVFCALDLVLFFLFWELTLPPFFFLIGLWGIGSQRREAAMKYTLFMLAGGVALLLAITLLAANHAFQTDSDIPQGLSFSLPVLLQTALPDNEQKLVFLLLLFGFAVKAPLVPFHTWLPTVAMEGPTHIVAILVGLKLGVYGILRFTMPLAPTAAAEYSWVISLFGAVTLIYAALIALQQTNLRRLLAYASVSHVGLVIVGIASLTMQGVQGAIFQILNFTLIASVLMLISGFVHHRLGSTDEIHLGGLAKIMPRLTCVYFLFMLASIGIPGTSGFPAEFLIIVGALTVNSALGIAALMGAILGAGYMLSFSRRAFLGPITHPDVKQSHDLQLRELALICIPAGLILTFGFFPDGILKMNHVASEMWLSRLTTPSP